MSLKIRPNMSFTINTNGARVLFTLTSICKEIHFNFPIGVDLIPNQMP